MSCGPFTRCSEEDLFAALCGLGLSLDEDGGFGEVARGLEGLRLNSRGRGVRGYLLADDGEEAELQDIKRLVLTCAHPGREVHFSGASVLANQTLLVVSSRAMHDGRIVHWTSTRTVLGAPGGTRTVRDRQGRTVQGGGER